MNNFSSSQNDNANLLRSTYVFNDYQSGTGDKFADDVFSLVKEGKITHLAALFNDNKVRPDDIKRILNTSDGENRTCLFYACYYDYRNLVLYLIIKGANITDKDSDSKSIFHWLCYYGNFRSLTMIKNF